MKLGLMILRATVGGAFLAHGTQKLFGWFDGPVLEGLRKGFEQMGLRPGKRNALIAGLGGGRRCAADDGLPHAEQPAERRFTPAAEGTPAPAA